MKTPWAQCLSFGLALFSFSLVVHAGSFVYQTEEEYFTHGDFDGDGRLDAVVFDRATGSFRIGYGQPGGSLLFMETRTSGVAETSALASGRFESTSRDNLAAARPRNNAINIISGLPDQYPGFFPITQVAGPGTVAAIRFDDSTGAVRDDLFVGFDYDPAGFAAGQIQNTSFSYEPTSRLSTAGPLRNANPIRKSETSEEKWIGVLERHPAESRFLFFDTTAASLIPKGSVIGLSEKALYAAGSFEGPNVALAFYESLGRELDIRPYLPETSSFAAADIFDLGAQIHAVVTLETPGDPDRILVLFHDSATAVIYNYSSAEGLTVFQTMDFASTSGPPRGAVSLADGSFASFHGRSGSESYLLHKLTGTQFETVAMGNLPSLAGRSAGANLLYFRSEPFVSDDPTFLGSFHFPDWTSDVSVSGNTQLKREAYLGQTTGLGGIMTETHTNLPSGSAYALGNQYRADVSIFSRSDPLGAAIAAPVISPPSGAYANAVEVTVQPAQTGETLMFRIGTGTPFAVYSQPVAVFTDATAEAYITAADGRISPVRAASYSFSLPPELQDSDQDGVPDFVESAKGLNIRGGADSDGDGFTDFDELVSVPPSDPSDPNSQPASRLETMGRLFLTATPMAYNGATATAQPVAPGTAVRVHDVSGVLLGEGTTDASGSARFEVFPVTSARKLLIASTDVLFTESPTQPNSPLGRQLAGIVPALVDEPSAFQFEYDASQPESQADAWIAAAQAAFASRQPPEISIQLDLDSTLHFALVERAIGMALESRGIGSSVERPDFLPAYARDLFPFLSQTVTDDEIARIEAPAETMPPYFSLVVRIQSLLDELQSQIENPDGDSPIRDLKALTEELYQISSTQHFALEGSLWPPIDALRLFLTYFHQLPGRYQELASVPSEALATLASDLDALLASLVSRPLITFEATLPSSQPFADCTIVSAAAGGQDYCLVDISGAPYQFPDTFTLLPGTFLTITGFTDVPPRNDVPALEVIDARAILIPVSSTRDSDGNLLADDWERLFFGTIGRASLQPSDGGSYTLLEEFLAGTDPTDPTDHPSSSPAVFSLEETTSESDEAGIRTMEFEWPENYFEHFEVILLSSSDLGEFESAPATVEHLGGNRFRVLVPITSEPRGFYQIALQLR